MPHASSSPPLNTYKTDKTQLPHTLSLKRGGLHPLQCQEVWNSSLGSYAAWHCQGLEWYKLSFLLRLGGLGAQGYVLSATFPGWRPCGLRSEKGCLGNPLLYTVQLAGRAGHGGNNAQREKGMKLAVPLLSLQPGEICL